MEGAMSAMSRKYQEEMLRLYGRRRIPDPPPEDAPNATDAPVRGEMAPPVPTEAPARGDVAPPVPTDAPVRGDMAQSIPTDAPVHGEMAQSIPTDVPVRGEMAPSIPTAMPLDAAGEPSIPTEAEEDGGTVAPMPDSTTPPPPADDGDKENVTNDPSDVGDTAFDYDPPALPETIAPFPPTLPAAWSAQEAYEAANTAEGYLRVITSAADGAIPVPGATVRITTRIGDAVYLRYLLVTDQNGESPTVALAAPPAALSQDPANADPFAVCDIAVVAEGYHPAAAEGVPIFAGVTSRQVFQLVPYPLGTMPDQAPAHDAAGRAED